MTSNDLIHYQMTDDINELKVINDSINEQKTFKSIEEFNLFYQKNIEQMKSQTTNYLNKIYKIITSDGTEYKITKRNCKDGKRIGGDIYLKKLGNTITKTLETDNINASIEELREQIHQLQDKNKILEEHVNKLSKVVDQSSQVINEYVLNVITPNNHRMVK
ncbi:hypothetical protein [Helicobacter typhlonius]|uniref:hypothetical protein n=1 Tax=Helicobacter typhlonius TaxID=76936 RepID=UPI002FE35F05